LAVKGGGGRRTFEVGVWYGMFVRHWYTIEYTSYVWFTVYILARGTLWRHQSGTISYFNGYNKDRDHSFNSYSDEGCSRTKKRCWECFWHGQVPCHLSVYQWLQQWDYVYQTSNKNPRDFSEA